MDERFAAGFVVGALVALVVVAVLRPHDEAAQVAALRAQVLAEVSLARAGLRKAEGGDA